MIDRIKVCRLLSPSANTEIRNYVKTVCRGTVKSSFEWVDAMQIGKTTFRQLLIRLDKKSIGTTCSEKEFESTSIIIQLYLKSKLLL
jgi:predicted 2-oxoglutarate/Fe(II)-dependent dioxygenase YbiX